MCPAGAGAVPLIGLGYLADRSRRRGGWPYPDFRSEQESAAAIELQLEVDPISDTFDYVGRALARELPGVSVSPGHELADAIHTSGQAIVWSGAREPAEHYWEQLSAAALMLAPLEGA